jgi:hypothetical protein
MANTSLTPLDKLTQLAQADGKDEKFVPTTLDQIWGEGIDHKYGTSSFEAYQEQIEAMDTAELYEHARKHGVVPVDDKERVRRNLLRAFREHIQSFRQPVQPPQMKLEDLPKDIQRILAEGR